MNESTSEKKIRKVVVYNLSTERTTERRGKTEMLFLYDKAGDFLGTMSISAFVGEIYVNYLLYDMRIETEREHDTKAAIKAVAKLFNEGA